MPEPTVFAVAALQHEVGAPRTFRPSQALRIAVVGRIAVNDDGGRAMLFRRVDLHRAMAARVAGDHDLALYVNSGGNELIVIRRQAVVDVYNRRSDRAGCRIGNESRT